MQRINSLVLPKHWLQLLIKIPKEKSWNQPRKLQVCASIVIHLSDALGAIVSNSKAVSSNPQDMEALEQLTDSVDRLENSSKSRLSRRTY